MVGPKAEVHVLVQAVVGVKVTAELVASRCGYSDPSFLEVCQWAQAADVPDQREVLAVRENGKEKRFDQEDWLCSRAFS